MSVLGRIEYKRCRLGVSVCRKGGCAKVAERIIVLFWGLKKRIKWGIPIPKAMGRRFSAVFAILLWQLIIIARVCVCV